MRRALVSLLVVASMLVAARPATGDVRIINGTPAAAGQFPYQVFVASQTSPNTAELCGGSVLSSMDILTAAHCVNNPSITQTIVIAGTTFVDPASGAFGQGGVKRTVASFVIH